MRMTNCISLATSDMLMTGLHFELQGPEAANGGNNFDVHRPNVRRWTSLSKER